MNDFAITAADVRDAARRIEGVAVRTPLLELAPLNERVGHRVLVKVEALQRTGSFKFPGAYKRLARNPTEPEPHGVCSLSMVNLAQCVAAAARLLSRRATAHVPAEPNNTPPTSRAASRR